MNDLLLSLRRRFEAYAERELSLWKDKEFLANAVMSIALLYLSGVVTYMAGLSATASAGAPAHDLILDALPRVDTSFIHGWFTGRIRDLMLVLLFLYPRYLPFGMKSAVLLTLVRSLFINLTHIGPYPDSIPVHSLSTFGGDLFFSGHVAFPLLMALVMWDKPFIRSFFIGIAVFLGASALLGHYHYSIDVAAAPFITYGIFVIAEKLFPRDRRLAGRGGEAGQGRRGDIR